MIEARQVLDRMADALADDRFRVSRDVVLPDGGRADVAASRTRFSWKGLVWLSQHVVVRNLDRATPDDARALFDSGFAYAKKVNRFPLLRGMQFGYVVVPVLVGESPDPELIRLASESPPKRWSLFEFPVVVDLTARRATFFRGTALWGAFFFSDLRRLAETYIEGSLPAADGRDA